MSACPSVLDTVARSALQCFHFSRARTLRFRLSLQKYLRAVPHPQTSLQQLVGFSLVQWMFKTHRNTR